MSVSRKRRTLIAVLAVVVVLFVWWRQRSSGVDSRYVGQWMDRSEQTWTFTSDGTFSLTDGPDFTHQQRWWVEGNKIVIFTPSRNKLTDAGHWVSYMARRLTGKGTYSLWFEDYPVTKFTGDTMQLDHGLDLKRVPKSPSPR